MSEQPGNIQRLLDIMARLRDPEHGCPWDVEQTFATIAPYTIEDNALVGTALQIVGDDFVSPFGQAHKLRKTEFITRDDLKGLNAKAKKGRLSVRENALGICMFSGYCPYGGLDNIVHCIECDELLADKRKRHQFVNLAQEVELELSVVGDKDSLYCDSLAVQHEAMKKVIDVLLI